MNDTDRGGARDAYLLGVKGEVLPDDLRTPEGRLAYALGVESGPRERAWQIREGALQEEVCRLLDRLAAENGVINVQRARLNEVTLALEGSKKWRGKYTELHKRLYQAQAERNEARRERDALAERVAELDGRLSAEMSDDDYLKFIDDYIADPSVAVRIPKQEWANAWYSQTITVN